MPCKSDQPGVCVWIVRSVPGKFLGGVLGEKGRREKMQYTRTQRMQAVQPPATMIGMYRDRGRAVLFRSGEEEKQTTHRGPTRTLRYKPCFGLARVKLVWLWVLVCVGV